MLKKRAYPLTHRDRMAPSVLHALRCPRNYLRIEIEHRSSERCDLLATLSREYEQFDHGTHRLPSLGPMARDTKNLRPLVLREYPVTAFVLLSPPNRNQSAICRCTRGLQQSETRSEAISGLESAQQAR
jgi:hypothetical protein